MKEVKLARLIERIEGEAELFYRFKEGIIEDVEIRFGFYRGIEQILQGKAAYDALVIAPRVCGICNHAHLYAAAKAIEDGYRCAGLEVPLTQKAQTVREFTLACELIQNHIKWFYFTLLPLLQQLTDGRYEIDKDVAVRISQTVLKAMALFSGQWPHSSYMIPGGVTCNPTHIEVMQAKGLVDEAVALFEQSVAGVSLEELIAIKEPEALGDIRGALKVVLEALKQIGFEKKGKSIDRFIALADSPLNPQGKSIATRIAGVDLSLVNEEAPSQHYARTVTYRGRMYEAGPLARAMVAKQPLIRNLHKRYKDSAFTRVVARVFEVALLFDFVRKALLTLDLSESSCTLNNATLPQTFEGIGVVEAARGSLLHRTVVRQGKIVEYQIITPTQWNLSRGNERDNGVAVEAIRGTSTPVEAEAILRIFDLCSVCTMQ